MARAPIPPPHPENAAPPAPPTPRQRAILNAQRWVQMAVVSCVGPWFFDLGLSFVRYESNAMWFFIGGGIAFTVLSCIFCACAAYRLAKLVDLDALPLAAACLIPCLNLIVLFSINRKAELALVGDDKR